jgi:hypothetical protein
MSFKTFQLEKVLMQGAQLAGSEGLEFDPEEGEVRGDKLAQQRAAINEQLGVPGVADELVYAEDLETEAVNEEIKVRRKRFKSGIKRIKIVIIFLPWPLDPS